MAKVSGITTSVTIDNASAAGKDISNDITSISVGTPRGVQEITGLDKSGVERLLLLADGTVSIKGVFNPAADKSHAVLSTCVSSTATRTCVIVYPGPATLTMELVLTTYNVERGSDGALTWTCDGSLATGTAPAWT
jgi:predicted secreted protein